MDSLPWTITLLLVTTALSFVIGNLLGALAAWPRAPQWVRSFATPFILFQGVPPVLMGVLLLFFIAFRLKLAPLGGAYSTGVVPDWSSPRFYLGCRSPSITTCFGALIRIGGGLGPDYARHGCDHSGRRLRQLC